MAGVALGEASFRERITSEVPRGISSLHLSLSFKQSRLSKNRGDEHAAQSKLKWLAQAAVLSAGWRLAGPVRLPLGRPGDLPHGFGGSA
jgi:hypothetical protein